MSLNAHAHAQQTLPSSSTIYRTIESAILDQYRGDEDQNTSLTSNIPSLDDNTRLGGSPPYTSYIDSAAAAVAGEVDNKSASNIAENKALVEDMFDQLALLEDLVSNKAYTPNTNVLEERASAGESGSDEDSTPLQQQRKENPNSTLPRCIPKRSSLGLASSNITTTKVLCRTPSTSSSLSQDGSNIDLSCLDDLLAEVDGHRTSGSHEKYAIVVQVSVTGIFFNFRVATITSYFGLKT